MLARQRFQRDLEYFESSSLNYGADTQRQLQVDFELQRLRTTVDELRANISVSGDLSSESQWSRWSPNKQVTYTNNLSTANMSANESQSAPSMFVLSTAPINSFQSLVGHDLHQTSLSQPGGGSIAALSVRGQTAKFAELQSLFTISPEMHDDETIQISTARNASPRSELDDMKAEIRRLRLQMNIDKHGKRLAGKKNKNNLKKAQRPIERLSTPSSRWQRRKFIEQGYTAAEGASRSHALDAEDSILTSSVGPGPSNMTGDHSRASSASPGSPLSPYSSLRDSAYRQQIIDDAISQAKTEIRSRDMSEEEFLEVANR
jgi:hypothetical protein